MTHIAVQQGYRMTVYKMLPMQAVIICLPTLHLISATLLYSNNTVLQIIGSVSVPIADLSPWQHINFDWGFQMNHNMPYSLTAFYNAPIWPTATSSERRMARESAYGSALKDRHTLDFSAGELYRGLEQLLHDHGYHRSCLLHSVCEVARTPFTQQHRNVITELITFVLTPSWHRGFAVDEKHYRHVFETAELYGLWGLNCRRVYFNCGSNPLHIFTKVIYDPS